MSLLFFLIACTGKTNNEAPTIEIVSTEDDLYLLDRNEVRLVADVFDAESTVEQLEIRWVVGGTTACDWSFGQTECWYDIGFEQIDVHAYVRDLDGLEGDDLAWLKATPNAEPVAEISSPTGQDTYYADEEILFEGRVSDLEDAPAALQAGWRSSLDGDLVVPAELDSEGNTRVSVYLSEGEHTISLFVEDQFGHVVQDEQSISVLPANQAPQCNIESPIEGAVYKQGQGVDFLAYTSDAESAYNRLHFVWTSSLIEEILREGTPYEEGRIQFARSDFSVGTHQITLTVTDERNSTCVDTRNIIVATEPIIESVSPSEEVFNEGEEVIVEILVSDQEDPSDQLQVVVSQEDGTILHEGVPSSEGFFSFSLSSLPVGIFEYTVLVTDTVGFTDTQTASFRVNSLPEAPNLVIDPSFPQTADTVLAIASDSVDFEGDDINYRFEWYLEGVLWSTDEELLSSYTQSGDQWEVIAYPIDPYGEGEPTHLSFSIANTAPEDLQVEIVPSSSRFNDSELSCVAQAFDIDSDVLTYTYEWTTNQGVFSTAETVLLDGSLHPFDVITCTVHVQDTSGESLEESTSVALENRTPVLGAVVLSASTIYNDQALSCSVASVEDLDGDEFSVVYQWRHNSNDVLVDGENIDLSAYRPVPGSSLSCAVTATDAFGASSESTEEVQILNRLPVLSYFELLGDFYNTESISCVAVATDEDEETPTYSYVWENISTQSTLGTEQQISLDPTTVSIGDEVRCTVTVHDALGSVEASLSGTVENRAPTESIVTLSPFPAVEGDALSCSYTAPQDLDGDAFSVSQQWLVDGILVQENTTSLTAVSPQDGQRVDCMVLATDARGAQTQSIDYLVVGVVPPSVESISLTDPAQTNRDIEASVVLFSDELENDMSYRWFVDGVEIVGETSLVLHSSYFSRGQEVQIQAYLGTMTTAVFSQSVVVGNAPPSTPIAIISTSAPLSGIDDLLCKAAGGRDPDLDTVSYRFQWLKNGTEWQGCPLNSAKQSLLPASYIEGGDEWVCAVIANDGQAESTGYSSRAVSPDTCYTTECDFGIAIAENEGLDFLLIDVSAGDPLQRYTLSQNFYMMTTEVTAEEYSALKGYNPSFFNSVVDLPVGNITWHETVAFANSITEIYNSQKGTTLDTCYTCTGTGIDVDCSVKSEYEGVAIYSCPGYRLPTEAEWEYAARSGTTADIWTGLGPNLGGNIIGNECSADTIIDDGTNTSFLDEYAWFCGNDEPHGTKSVAGKTPNGFGLYDMSGNVWEWSHDLFDSTYPSSSQDPVGPTTGHIHVLKGGRWGNVPSVLKLSLRTSGTDTYKDRCVGARLVRSYLSSFSDVDLQELCTTTEDCDNGYDEDYDGLIDCADPDCASQFICAGSTGEFNCEDGLDNEGDMLIDCADPECAQESYCLQGSNESTPSQEVCAVFDGCLAANYGLEGPTSCLSYIYTYDAGDNTYAPWIECILQSMEGQIGECSAEESIGCTCSTVEACDSTFDTPLIESTNEEVIDCTDPAQASSNECIDQTIDCTNTNEWCDPSCLTACHDPVQIGDPENCGLCIQGEEDTSAPEFELIDCSAAFAMGDENYCHMECLMADGLDCEEEPHESRCQECFPGGGHHSEDGSGDCDDASDPNSVACEVSYEEACMGFCHWMTQNQDPDYYSESLCYFDSCHDMVDTHQAETDAWFACMIQFPDPQDAISTEACVLQYPPPFVP